VRSTDSFDIPDVVSDSVIKLVLLRYTGSSESTVIDFLDVIHRPVFFYLNGSETGLCLSPEVKNPAQLGQIARAIFFFQTPELWISVMFALTLADGL
jgi:hypothetical protein